MTISTTTYSEIVAGNGVTTVFNFPFVADLPSDIVVQYIDALGNRTTLSPAQYTLTINSVPAGQLWGIGGSVTYPLAGPPIAPGTSLAIFRAVPYVQSVSIGNQGAFYPQAVEQALDILELQIQQLVGNQGQVFLNSPLALTFRVFGGGSSPTPGILGDMLVPFPFQITSWTLQADQTGSMAIDIWGAPYADNTPPVVANSICTGQYPTLTSQQQIQSTNVALWTNTFNANTALRFNLRSIATIQNFTLTLVLARTDLPVLH